MKVTLINKTRRMKVINLLHDTYCKALGRCSCLRICKDRLLASSLTIPAGGSVEHIPDAVLKVKEVARAVRRSELKVLKEREQKKAEKKPRKKPGRKPKKNKPTSNEPKEKEK